MKTTHNTLTIWSIALFLSGTALMACGQSTTGAATQSAPANDQAKTTMLVPMQQTVTRLKKLVVSGDPDFDYALQAKAQTQGLQDLLNLEIKTGKDTAMQNMAQTMLPTTTDDITLLDNTVRQLKPTRPNQSFAQQQSRNIEAMNLKIQQTGSSDKLTSDLDKNFTTLLLDQRQDAIDMANTYLQYGKNDTLRNYAQKLVDQAKQNMARVKASIKQ